jgi:nicotinate (nicotinamide) nucleotide adenylyltransferase
MDTRELQALVAHSHDAHFGRTSLRERLRDLQGEVGELVHHRDEANLREELGDAAWSLLQLCNEVGVSVEDVVGETVRKLDARADGRKVALIGTSANPITNAHLTMALEVLALTDVDQVWFLVVGEHPWAKKLMPAEHRLEMTRRAVAKYPRLRVCDFEVVHGPEIYPKTRETAELLRDYLLPAYPGTRFRWVMGSDVAQTFHQWRGSDWMAANVPTIVLHRLGYDFDRAASVLAGDAHVYLRDNIVTSNISSTLVRERGRAYEHEKLLALVPEVVWDYLVEHRLLDPDVLR